MELSNIVDVLGLVWTIGIAIGGFIIYKLIPYGRTKISTNEYYNVYACFISLEYELIGTFVAIMVELLMSINFKDSTWKRFIIEKNMQAYIVVTLVYILGIFLITMKKAEKKPIYMCMRNIIFGGLIYITLAGQFILMLEEKYDEKDDYKFYLIVICVILFQVFTDIIPEKVKNVKYIVLTRDEKYDTLCEPIKRGKYYYIKITDEKNDLIKMVQLLEEKVEKIEYIVENAEEKNIEVNDEKIRRAKICKVVKHLWSLFKGKK